MIVRVLLALDPPIPRRELPALRALPGVLVASVRTLPRLWQTVGRTNTDIVVVSESLLPEPPGGALETLKELPDAPAVVVLTGEGDAARQAELFAAGCDVVLSEGVPRAGLQEVLAALVARRRTLAASRSLSTRSLQERPRLADFASSSVVMQRLLGTVQRVIDANAPLLLLGETGTGKEHLARAIHRESRRAAGPFVAINCGALPETLLESELFGHEEGAFTGATRSRRGHFELAHGGTLFLDEIGDVALHLQVKLLRALQEQEVQRLGGEKPIPVDVRIMAATNRDLAQEVEAGRFRRDLFYRLGVVTVTLPPLRARREDVPDLAEGYVARLQGRMATEVQGITPEALAALRAYDWPGNIRELFNVVERAMLLSSSDVITHLDLRDALGERSPPPADVPLPEAPSHDPGSLSEDWLRRPWREVRAALLDRVEKAYLAGLLAATHGRVGETAERAGMLPRSLYDKLRRHGLRKEDYR